MHLHRCLGGSEMRPWKHRQALIDGGRIQRVYRVGQIQPQVFAGVKCSGLSNQAMSEFGVDMPVAQFVGIGQCGTRHRISDAHVIKLGRLRREAGFDVAQTLAVGELRESQNAEVFGTGQRPDVMIATMPSNDAIKGLPRKEFITWAIKGLPTYIAISNSRKTGRLHEGGLAVQVGDTLKTADCSANLCYRAPLRL